MKLTAADGRSFELFATGYQFPNITDDEYDSNWLYVTINLEGFSQPWSSNDPSLMTWELKLLATWLRTVVTKKPEREIRFIEPNLVFHLVQKEAGEMFIRISLNLETKPEWAEHESSFSFDINVNEEQIQNSAKSLEAQLQRFPGRGGIFINPTN